jgi:hypothetical protein
MYYKYILHCKDSGNATRPGQEKYYIFHRTEQWLQYYKKLRSNKKIGSLAGRKNINKEGRQNKINKMK